VFNLLNTARGNSSPDGKLACHPRWARLVAILAVAAGLFPARSLTAGDFLTESQLKQALARPVGITWRQRGLRDALLGLGETYQFAVLLDRRVDPGQQIDLAVDNAPLEEALRKIARQKDLEIAVVGPVVYMGPSATALRLRTLVALRQEEIRGLRGDARSRLLRTRPCGWPRLATPQEVLADVQREYGIAITNREHLPHDLWPAVELPPLNLAERLSLILAGYHLTFHIHEDGNTVTLTRIPEAVELTRRYRGNGRAEILAERWAALVPEAKVEAADGYVVVAGRAEEHEQIEQERRESSGNGSRTAKVTTTRKQYTLTVREVPLRALLETLAKRLGLTLQMDEEALTTAGADLDRLVSIEVKDASLDELLKAALADSGIVYERNQHEIHLRPANSFQQEAQPSQ